MARINRIQRVERGRGRQKDHTCIRGRLNDVVILIRIGALGPGMQSELVAGAENRTWCRCATQSRYERSAGVTVMNLRDA